MDNKSFILFNSLTDFDGNNLNDASFVRVIKKLNQVDFNLSVSVWEFFLTKYSKILNGNLANSLVRDIYFLFKEKNAQKINKVIFENKIFLNAIFLQTEAIKDKEILLYLVNLIKTSKFEPAGEILKLLAKNQTIDYSEILKDIFETYFHLLLQNAKEGDIIIMNKKTAFFFLQFVSKIKGEKKALLTQRVNELVQGQIWI
ncbi:MAG: hypothetical protein FWG51_02115 [Firmicutes bacterium]|nr:hypothetical protein [Bacillota bacterium]